MTGRLTGFRNPPSNSTLIDINRSGLDFTRSFPFVGGSFVDEDSVQDYTVSGFCAPPYGVVEGNEECDPPGINCTAQCKNVSFCGDGTLDPGEVCDDGNNDAGDGCDPNCQPEPA